VIFLFGGEGSGVTTWTNENRESYFRRNVIGGDSWIWCI